MDTLFTLADIGLGVLILAGIPAYPLLQVWAPKRLPRGWREAAMLPFAFGTVLLAWCLATIAGHQGPSLLPVLFFAPAAVLYLIGLLGLRAVLASLRDRSASSISSP